MQVWIIHLTFVLFIEPTLAAVYRENRCLPGEPVNYTLEYGDLGTFDSTNYPANYNHNSSCSFLFTGPVGSRILVTVNEFHTEKCCDHLRIGNGHDQNVKTSLIFNFAGLIAGNKAYSSFGNQMYMNFTSDGENNFKGYSVDVEAYPAEGNTSTLFTNLINEGAFNYHPIFLTL